MKDYIKIMRLDHWVKQLFIIPGFVCAFFIGEVNFSYKILIYLLIGLLATNFVASANYVINEWLDAKFDKFHPTKKNRPLVSSNVKPIIIYIMWLSLALCGFLIGYLFINKFFFVLLVWLFIMGILYNVEPIRTKDVFILDVLSESVNNAIRLLLGWFIIRPNVVVPISLVLGYWMGGAFLMAVKRFAEYKMIRDKNIASKYRKSFKYYSENSLMLSSFFYAMCSIFFIGIFLIKYRIELILFVPFLIGLFVYYFWLSFKKDSVVQKPEKLYKEKNLMLYGLFLLIIFIVLMMVDIPFLDIFTK